MQHKEVNLIEEKESVQPRLNVLRLTLTTLFWTVIAGTLLCTCLLSAFPYTAMKFYSQLDLKVRTLESAEKYLKLYGDKYEGEAMPPAASKYADALLCAFNVSSDIMNDAVEKDGYKSGKARDYAPQVIKHATEYLSYSSLKYDRSKIIDDYNLTSPFYSPHPSLYPFSDYAAHMRTRAQLITGDATTLTAESEALIGHWDAEGGLDMSESTEISRAPQYFLMLRQLNEYLQSELYSVGFYELDCVKQGKVTPDGIALEKEKLNISSVNAPFKLFIDGGRSQNIFTPLYDKLDKNIDKLKDFIYNGSNVNSSAELLPYASYLKNLSEFEGNMTYAVMLADAFKNIYGAIYAGDITVLPEKWNKHNLVYASVTIDGNRDYRNVSLTDWYKYGLNYDYVIMKLRNR